MARRRVFGDALSESHDPFVGINSVAIRLPIAFGTCAMSVGGVGAGVDTIGIHRIDTISVLGMHIRRVCTVREVHGML